MSPEKPGPKAISAPELKAQIELERVGRAFLAYRDEKAERILREIDPTDGVLSIGRSDSASISFGWDPETSSIHAMIETIGEHCALVDDGLSTNGSFVNGERVQGRRLLHNGDVIRIGTTPILFHSPTTTEAEATIVSGDALSAAGVTPAQRRVLISLCRPYKDARAFAVPATNPQIAAELHLSVDAVKTHLRALFEKFGLESAPRSAKRVALVERALQSGLISDRDL